MNQILYLALVQKHTSVQLDGTQTLQLVLCICTFFIFFFLIHMFVIWKHMFQNTVQNTCIIKILEYFVEKKIKEIHVFPDQALFFSTNFAIFAVVSSTKFVPGRGWNRSLHVPLNPTWGLAIDWLEKANKKHTSKTWWDRRFFKITGIQ